MDTSLKYHSVVNYEVFFLTSVSLTSICPDVDECSDRTDEDLLCDHFCHNYIGGYYCSCRYGYLLHSDNRTCRGEAEALKTSRMHVAACHLHAEGGSMHGG